MSAFAIAFEKKRAVVASDTLAYIPHRREAMPLGFTAKVFTLPHQRGMILSRGQMEITVSAWAALQMRSDVSTIEDTSVALPAIFRAATQVYCQRAGIADARGVGLLEAVLIGWSQAKRTMRLWQFLSYRDYAPEEAGPAMYGLHAFPRLSAGYMPRVTGTVTDKHLLRVIEAAGRYFEDEPATMCGARVGGEVLVTEITPQRIEYRAIHRFADYAVVRNASAAIARRIARGDMDVDRAVADGLVPLREIVDSAADRKAA